ncbi:8-amino-7-oxononanoate synthase [hydrothermal vent metagenome]|uniref:8-amino-7-oxononanoate synthase n=1 Tax=hydrothermal vent metagenome TaxID=652676 RepID=A0A3B0S7M1_9ZZZZ
MLLSALQDDLLKLSDEARFRELSPQNGVDFSSNDYLGLAGSRRLADAVTRAIDAGVPVGSGGSRLLRGNHPEHELLETEAAAFFKTARTLFFSSGFAANMTLLSTLPQRDDLVIYDALIHASAHEGMKLSRAKIVEIPHNDASAVEDAIVRWRQTGATGRPWIVVESLYSMGGDAAPLEALADIASKHDAMLIIDEAHATGVFGEQGRGLSDRLHDRENIISLHTCGKALGCEGALVCGPKIACDFLINRGRGFIFSTAPSPLMASAVRESLHILADEPKRRIELRSNIDLAERVLAPFGVESTGSQILPLFVGENERTMKIAQHLQGSGFDIRGIRPPTVPHGTARLRISLTLNVSKDEIKQLGNALELAL